ncbi:MAG TPA: hypothetical protein VFM70_02280 [Salinimicrobium sp.]|nr:hypothetical protein [Salinimicrobium sp.]
MELKELAKKAIEFMAVRKGIGMTGSLMKWGAVAGIGYLGYKLYKNKTAQNRKTA